MAGEWSGFAFMVMDRRERTALSCHLEKQSCPVEYLLFAINKQAKAPEITPFCLYVKTCHVINLLFVLQAISNLRHIFNLLCTAITFTNMNTMHILSSSSSRTD